MRLPKFFNGVCFEKFLALFGIALPQHVIYNSIFMISNVMLIDFQIICSSEHFVFLVLFVQYKNPAVERFKKMINFEMWKS